MYIYFSFDTIFERVWLLSRVPLYRVTVAKETTEPVRTKFLVVKLESPFLKNYDRRHDLTVTEYLCHKGPRICSVGRTHKQGS